MIKHSILIVTISLIVLNKLKFKIIYNIRTLQPTSQLTVRTPLKPTGRKIVFVLLSEMI